MKKVLALVLVLSMVLGSFGFAFAATPAQTNAGKVLEELKVLQGYNGDLMLDQNLKRQDIIVLLSRLMGAEQEAAKFPIPTAFTDVTDAYYKPFIGWAQVEGLTVGIGENKFGFDQELTVKELVTMLLRALGHESKHAYDNAEKLGVELGLVATGTNFAAVASRAVMAEATVNTLKAPITTDAKKSLGTKLGFPGYEIVPAKLEVEVTQAGTKKLAVKFNRALTAAEKAELTYEVKFGFVPYTVSVTYNEANDIATLESSFAFPTGDYTVTVKGLEAATVKVVAEKVSKVEIGAVALQKAANQNLKIKAYNQFNEEMTVGLNISVYNATTGSPITVSSNTIDLSGAALKDIIVVTVTHTGTGITATKTYEVVAASTITQMSFGPATPLEGKTRITKDETGLALAYSLVDQYGQSVKFAQKTASATHGDVTFMSSNNDIVNPATFAVDANGKLTFNAGTTAGTAIITAINSKTGATATFQIKVEDVAKVKTFQMSHPGVLVAANENVKIPFMAVDSFGKALTTKDFAASATNIQVTFTVVHPTINMVHNWSSSTGELTFNFTGTGTVTIYAWVDGQIASQFTVDIKPAASPTKITGIKNLLTVFTATGSVALEAKNLVVVDNYGRVIETLPAGYDFTVAVKDSSTNILSTTTKSVIGVAEGSKIIKLELTNNGNPVANSAFEYTARVIKDTDVVSYEIKSVGTLYGSSTHSSITLAGDYAKAISIVGKDAAGNQVAINQANKITNITSSNPAVVAVDLPSSKIYAKDAGTSVVAVWSGANKLAELTVEASKAAPITTTAKFEEAKYTVAVSATKDLAAELTVKDQYGVEITPTGVWTSSNTSRATVTSSGVATRVTAGEVTISFVTSNGIVVTVVLE